MPINFHLNMRKISSLIILIGLIMAISKPCSGEVNQTEITTAQDSTVDVIGWFCKHDTAIYWIQENTWKINNTDTIKTAGASTKVMISVTDSTETGYKMDYTFLDVRGDSLADSELGNFQNKIITLLSKKIIGTTISFETDDCGKILKFNNLDKIKKQANSVFKETIKEMEKLPWIKDAKKMGIDLKKYAKIIDSDQLVEGYIEELKLLLLFHGNSYNTGEFTETEEATETQYANETYSSITIDDDGCYSILSEVVNTIPQSEIKALMSSVIDDINNPDLTDSFNANFDEAVNVDCNISSYFKIAYLPNGWPYEAVKQESTTIDQNAKVKQKYIYLDSYSFYNY